jgi:hypothetical protein
LLSNLTRPVVPDVYRPAANLFHNNSRVKKRRAQI